LNKKLIGLGMILAANGAFAQATSGTNSVEIYGVLDAAVGYQEYSLSTNGQFPASVNPLSATKTSVSNSVTGMFNGGIQDSRWGFRGTEDLGGGMKAFFTLESGFNIPTGQANNGTGSLAGNSPTASTVSANTSLNGQLFSRQAFVGLSSETLGSVAFGRNYAPFYDIAVVYDPVQNSQLFSPLGFSGTIGGGGGVSEDTRVDNSIKYKNKIGDFNFGALYKFGGVAGNSTAEGGYTLNAGYEAGPFGIQAGYEVFKDALKTGTSTVAGDISVTDYNSNAFMIAGKYSFGEATIKAGFEQYTLKAPSDSVAALGLTSLYGYTIGNSTTFSSADQKTDVWWFGGDYNFSPAMNLAVGFYDQNPKRSDDAKQLNGNIYSYSALLDYHFTKRTDVYGGLMYSQYKGDAFPSATFNSSNYITAVGLRHKF
jgi:predicted porin